MNPQQKREGRTLPGGLVKAQKQDHTVLDDSPQAKKGRTIGAISIAPVKQVVTKRGKTIEITTNEQDDIDWTLLENYDFPPDKLKAGMDKEMSSLRDFDVFTETTTRSMGKSGTIIPTK